MFIVQLIVGAALGALSLALNRRAAPRFVDPERFVRGSWAVYLAMAALIYVGFAGWGGAEQGWLGVELAGLVGYSLVAWLGFTRAPKLIGLGWLSHVLWDLALHPGGHPGYVPGWYPAVCLGFDLLVGGWLAATLGSAAAADRGAQGGGA